MSIDQQMQQELHQLAHRSTLRTLPQIHHQGRYVWADGHKMLNLSSNDYLGLTTHKELHEEFLSTLDRQDLRFGASSSRLLTGNFTVYHTLETMLANAFGTQAALVFNSGYHANIGILPAIAHERTVILADKLVHASLIDGMRLSAARTIRYRHNDYDQLERLVNEYANRCERLLLVTESLFSMDGDVADLRRLVAIKRTCPHALLYIDEAHAIGVRGANGLGCAEEQQCVADIDLLVGTFGKALASVGAYVVCSDVMRSYLINKMRPLIFSTALPPICVEWSAFIFGKLSQWNTERAHLLHTSTLLRHTIKSYGDICPSQSHIIPLMTGSAESAVSLSAKLQAGGFYALPVRPPTVPEGSSRIRISLTASVTSEEVATLISLLNPSITA